ncbi:MAG: hypothetical protein IPM35_04700 [Myxococcales bacterium]|nr:hypothetical protein [Myxococcales bacterium]
MWLTDRVARGFTTTKDSAGHWRIQHIRPCFGERHPEDLDPDDFCKLSRGFDGAFKVMRLWSSAVNIWWHGHGAADDATESKHDTIRCRDDNLADGVRARTAAMTATSSFSTRASSSASPWVPGGALAL